MDLTLISNWNKTVRSKENVIPLGDFGDRNVLRILNFSKMVFLKGNYDENKEENFEIACFVLGTLTKKCFSRKKDAATMILMQSCWLFTLLSFESL